MDDDHCRSHHSWTAQLILTKLNFVVVVVVVGVGVSVGRDKNVASALIEFPLTPGSSA